jgi:hypothetical protein
MALQDDRERSWTRALTSTRMHVSPYQLNEPAAHTNLLNGATARI